jgi:hypothetical protein
MDVTILVSIPIILFLTFCSARFRENQLKRHMRKIVLSALEEDTQLSGQALHQALTDAKIPLTDHEFCLLMHQYILDRLIIGQGINGHNCHYSLFTPQTPAAHQKHPTTND